MFLKCLLGLLGTLALLALLLAFFPWDKLRGPINRYASDYLGRRFEITQHLDVHLGRVTTVRAEGIEFANPSWASEPYLIKARAAEFEIRLWPLLFGHFEFPVVRLTEPQFGLQIEPDGRRSWALARNTSDAGASPDIGLLLVDQGVLKYLAAAQGADLTAHFSMAPDTAADTKSDSKADTKAVSKSLPLSFKAAGKWRGEAFNASGRTGGVLPLSRNAAADFPLDVTAAAGKTTLKAKGTVENLRAFSGLSASFDLQGQSLDALYRLLGVVLPATPPYKVSGQLTKHGNVWDTTALKGKLGRSDVAGQLRFDASQSPPQLSGKVQSRLLDFDDLRPVIGLPVKALGTGPATTITSTIGDAASSKDRAGPLSAAKLQTLALQKSRSKVTSAPAALPTQRKVLPTAVLDLQRLRAMNADVVYSALAISHVEALPLDSGSVHVKLQGGVLVLDPLVLGVAGGSLAGRVKVDTNPTPARFETRLDVRNLALNKLFPTIQTTKSSLGKIGGQLSLQGRGNSMAQMLGTASGDVAVLMGRGELSNILLEFVGLDGGEIIKFLLIGDRTVPLRCAAAAFDVKNGLMQSRVLLLDTTDTVINGNGQISLADETLNLVLEPKPKDLSILSLRSPLKITGTFAAPKAGPDKAALAGRAGLAIALGLINPLLALAATIETGPGQDADCTAALSLAAKPAKSAQKSSKAAPG
ncbi:MAG: AsmA family protein [Chitinophagaceae bacterium]|nr:AsmA family protein [Polaromonas sp.]